MKSRTSFNRHDFLIFSAWAYVALEEYKYSFIDLPFGV